jgi:hypothetical protein
MEGGLITPPALIGTGPLMGGHVTPTVSALPMGRSLLPIPACYFDPYHKAPGPITQEPMAVSREQTMAMDLT